MTIRPLDPAARQPTGTPGWPEALGDLFRLTGAIGPEAANDRDDVIRTQILLGHTGDLDLEKLGGPTGWPGGELIRGLRRYQRRKGLTVDGLMLPDGETINTLQNDLYDRLARYWAPTTAEVDDHHDKLARYRPGEGEETQSVPRTALVMPGENAPAYVQRLDAPRSAAVMNDIDVVQPLPFKPEAQVAQVVEAMQIMQAQAAANTAAAAGAAGAAGAASTSKQLPPGVTPEMDKAGQQLGKWVDEKVNLLTLPVQMYGHLINEASAPPSVPLDPTTEAAGKTPPLKPSVPGEPKEYSGDLLTWGTQAIQAGIQDIFGTTVERHETDNTRLSSNIIVEQCNKVIDENIELHGFEHIAGASVGGAGLQELPEKAIKDGQNAGGGGHSFPDVLYQRGKDELIAINSATESAPDQYIGREVRSFIKLVKNMGEWVAEITGKKRPDEDIDEYRERARRVCEKVFAKHLEKRDAGSNSETENSAPPSP